MHKASIFLLTDVRLKTTYEPMQYWLQDPLEGLGQFENSSPYGMLQELKLMFKTQVGVKGYVKQLEHLGYVLPEDLSVGLILNGLTSDFAKFAATPQVMAIQGSRIQNSTKKSQKAKGNGKGKVKGKDDTCHHCKEVGHWKRNYHVYLAELINKKKQIGIASSAVSKNDVLYFNDIPRDDISEIDMLNLVPNVDSVYNDYALESTTRNLKMVPAKKVDKTLYKLWYEKVPNLSVLKVCGCEALEKRDMHDKLQQRSIKCTFVRYSKETISYYFYFSPKNKTVVVRYAELLEKNLISQEVSRRAGELKDSQDEDTSPFENTTKISYGEVEEHSLGNLNEPINYKAAMLDSESNKWLKAINAEMKSMKYNQVWHLVDLPLNGKTIGSTWIFKKKTNMDGNVHTYKAHLVTRGFTQTYGVDYEETFSPITDIRAIRIPIAVATFYDYEKVCKLQRSIYGLNQASRSWNKTFDEKNQKSFAIKDLEEVAFNLGIKIYQDRTNRLIRLHQSAYMDKILEMFTMDNSIGGNIPMQERLDLNKTQGASTPEENLGEPYWTVVKTILKYLRNTKGYVFILNGGAVDWKSSKKSPTTMFATEAEYIVALEAAMEAVWIKSYFRAWYSTKNKQTDETSYRQQTEGLEGRQTLP
nr:hypothetical protein [Tanacetum cinerariifolium]